MQVPDTHIFLKVTFQLKNGSVSTMLAVQM